MGNLIGQPGVRFEAKQLCCEEMDITGDCEHKRIFKNRKRIL